MLASCCLACFDVHQYFFVFSVLVVNPVFLFVEYCFVLYYIILDVIAFMSATFLRGQQN